jgi:hypothetical protein
MCTPPILLCTGRINKRVDLVTMTELFGLGLTQMLIAFGANLAISVVFVLVVYKLVEQRIALGVVGALVMGAVIIWIQATVGEAIWTFNFDQRRNIIVIAGIGAALGIVGTLSVWKPDLE